MGQVHSPRSDAHKQTNSTTMPAISSGSAPRCIGAAAFICALSPLSSSQPFVIGVRTHRGANSLTRIPR
jgi:hypothetical protein